MAKRGINSEQARQLGLKYGRLGGLAVSKSMSLEKRRARGKAGSTARWNKPKKTT